MSETAPLSEFPVEKINEANRQAKMLFLSNGSSLIAFFIVSRFVPQATPGANAEIIRIVLFVLAGTAVFASTLFKPIYLRTVPATPEARLARLRTSAVLSVALAEMPAIMGFILFFFTGQRTEFYGLLVVSAYLFVRHIPQREAWENYVRRGSDSR
jgi:hypothetical protein